jgi:hypothetical protein
VRRVDPRRGSSTRLESQEEHATDELRMMAHADGGSEASIE